MQISLDGSKKLMKGQDDEDGLLAFAGNHTIL